MKKFINLKLAAAGLFLSASAFAQDSTSVVKPFSPISSFRMWSIGVNGGILSPTAFIGGKNDFTNWKANVGYGGYVKMQVLPALGIRADFLRGKLSADNPKELGNGNQSGSPVASYETNLNWSGALSAEFTILNALGRKSGIQPYLSAGAGIAAYKPTITPVGGSPVLYKQGDNIHELIVPVGAGVKFGLSKSINLDLGYTVNFIDGDNLDGYYGGTTSDRFSYGHAGLEFVLGNPAKPALAGYNNDVALEYDYLAKNKALSTELESGKAKNAAALAAANAELAKMKADADGDGVSDFFDKCLGTASGVKVDGSGCPLPVPVVVTPTETKIYITEEDKKVVSEAIKNLEFDFGKATIRAKSFPSLDKVAELLVNKNFSLKLAGHTDDVGSNEANLRLSKARAEAIKTYLVGKGVNASRVEATGYGENQPIATNKTAAGRQKNRRVEFTLY